jgi:hypothetical protein
MVPESMVVEDGSGEIEARPREKSGWVLAAVAFGLGLALGTLIAAPGDVAPVDTTDGLERGSPDVTETTEATDSGISGEVAEFPDALVAVGDTIGSGHEYLLWPVAGKLVTRSMTGGSDVQLDSTGRFIAVSEELPDTSGSLLSAGRYNAIRPVASGVTSYDWHDSNPGQLAYTIENDEKWELYRVTGGFGASLVRTADPNSGTVAEWGDWGYAIQLPDDRVQLLTPSGEPKDVESGVALASHESGWVLAEDNGGLKLVSAGGGVRTVEGGEIPDLIQGAAFSPDGSRAAVVTRAGVHVIDLDDPEVNMLAPGANLGWVTWSSDSRFVVAPAASGVAVYDVMNEESYRVFFGQQILAAQTLPLSSQQAG